MKRQQTDDWKTSDANEDNLDAEPEGLSFEDDDAAIPPGDEIPQAEGKRALSRETEQHEESVAGGEFTNDDLAPEVLIPDDGARSSSERGAGTPADRTLRKVGSGEIGAGEGLDEAELGRADPLDGKPWEK